MAQVESPVISIGVVEPFPNMPPFSGRCFQCGMSYWFVDGSHGYCRVCWIRWDTEIIKRKLTMVARGLPFAKCTINDIPGFLAGSLEADEVARSRKRAALYVILVSPGCLRQFPDHSDSSDPSPMEYKRDLLDKIITFLV